MLGLCEITSCRRQALLRYFGEVLGEQPCGNCDNCLEPVETWDGTEAAQMALSAAYRTGQRFGVNHLIDLLKGSGRRRSASSAMISCPPSASVLHLDKDQWRSVYRQLVARGYLRVAVDQFGALCLEERCRPLLRGEETLSLRRDVKKRGGGKQTKTPLPAIWMWGSGRRSGTAGGSSPRHRACRPTWSSTTAP